MVAEGEAYAPDAYRAAQDAVGQLDAEVEAQSQKFALTRSYDRVSELAAAAGTAADRVQQAANTEKERLRTEAGRIAADARRALEEATRSLEKMPEAQTEGLKTDAAAAQTSLGEVESLLAAGQLKEAQQKAEMARQAITQISDTIQEAEAVAVRAEAERRSPDQTAVPRSRDG